MHRKLLAAVMLLTLASSCAWADTEINASNFPDGVFREFVSSYDTNNDGILQDSEIISVEKIDIPSRNISSLKGIEFFSNLVELDCAENNITSLDMTRNKELEVLFCEGNPLTSLNISGLDNFFCLDCSDTKLGSNGLNVKGLTNLQVLYCDNIGLKELDLSDNKELTSLSCAGNQITTLALSDKDCLVELDCTGNPISGDMLLNTVVEMQKSGDRSVSISSFADDFSAERITLNAFTIDGEKAELVRYVDDNGYIFAEFAKSPAVIRYSYDTGLDNVQLIVNMIDENANNIAPCTNGIFKGTASGDLLIWKGIPYAKQPVGSLRWKAPEAADANNEFIESVNFASSPLQHYSSTNPKELLAPQGEDCLALNVWNNSRDLTEFFDPDVKELKPVMVWVHGGAFNSGSTSNPDYDGTSFIQAHDDVLLVTVGYRVGLMGFIDFANSGISGGENFPDSGNLGLLDVLQALRWIKANIESFGGDPDNVTLFGQSSGSAMVSLLMAMPESKGLFHRAITQSGAVSMTSSVADCLPLTQKLVELTGAKTMDDLLALSSQDLHDLTEQLTAYTNFPERDGRIVSESPYAAFAENSKNFDFLVGSNADEVNYWSLAIGSAEGFAQFVQMAFYQIVQGVGQVSSADAANAEEFVRVYMAANEGATEHEAMCAFLNDLLFRGPAVLEADNHAGRKYMYFWKYPAGILGLGACHSIDLFYIFRGILLPVQLNEALSEKVRDMWVNFAATGNPSTESETWPEYSAESRATMIIDDPLAVENNFLVRRYELIRPLLEYGFSGRELISGIESMGGGGDTPSEPESQDIEPVDSHDIVPDPVKSEDVVPAPESEDVTVDPGSAGGGCNAGFAVPLALAVTAFAAKRRD